MPATDSSSNGGARYRRLAPLRESSAASDGERWAAIEGLTVALGRLRRGAAALKAENQELRAEIAGLPPAASGRRAGDAPTRALGSLAEVALPTGLSAPGAARLVIGHCLTGLVSHSVLHDAELLVSELVTNTMEHGRLGDGDTVLVRVYLGADRLRLEIENPGTAGDVAVHPPDRRSRRGGFGLNLVEMLSANWGVNRSGSTTVWLEMGRA
jgi:anti-sigma regulatory factor (Ser/Thr protein kinase)